MPVISRQNGKLVIDPTFMQAVLDRAGMFYFSSKKGVGSTRVLIMQRGCTANLNEPGKLATTCPYEELDGMCWVSMNDGSARKVCVGFQALGNKIYALLHDYPLKDSGSKKWRTDDDIYREALCDKMSKIASFDEPICNTSGCMAESQMNDLLKGSNLFTGKYLQTVKLIQSYASEGPVFDLKTNRAFDLFVNRQRKELSKTYGKDKDGEIAAIESMMNDVEPTRMALEDVAGNYDLPPDERVIMLKLDKDFDATADAAAQAAETLCTMLK